MPRLHPRRLKYSRKTPFPNRCKEQAACLYSDSSSLKETFLCGIHFLIQEMNCSMHPHEASTRIQSQLSTICVEWQQEKDLHQMNVGVDDCKVCNPR